MRIAIVGAPGSGKGALMDALAKTDQLKDHTFISSPIGELAEQGRGLGPKATYAENLLLYALQQRAIELAPDDQKIVQSGTVLQRLAHLATAHDDIMLGDSHEINQIDVLFRLMPTIDIMTGLVIDTYRTDLTFMLTRDLPLDVTGKLTYDEKIQFHLQDALDRLRIPYRVLVGSAEDQAKEIVEAMNERTAADTPDR